MGWTHAAQFKMVKDQEEVPQIDAVSTPPPPLQKLVLIERRPVSLLPSFTKSGMAYACQGICWEAVVHSSELHKLTALYLHDYPGLDEIIIEKGALVKNSRNYSLAEELAESIQGSFVFAFPSLNWTSTGGTFNSLRKVQGKGIKSDKRKKRKWEGK
ncbi:hypothetical protein CK203_087955 [Vitis vinifera]|uniref:Uncharacterized protein n=1 Tax=Vitis vinifera TaxID=29760 RepID=A0A438D7Z2_VITVI|nr:hypothetical protein CK203_087955 [Vitis vinifera]